MPFPVEYKRGKPKGHDADRLQLCAQAMCLEEMLDCPVPQGALFYGRTRRREQVIIGQDLRSEVAKITAQIRAMLESGRTPPARKDSTCRSCSMLKDCLPEHTNGGGSAGRYLRRQIAFLLEEP